MTIKGFPGRSHDLLGKFAVTAGLPWGMCFFTPVACDFRRAPHAPARFEIVDALAADAPPFTVAYAVSTATGHILFDDIGVHVTLSATDTRSLDAITAAKYRLIATDDQGREFIWRQGRLAISEGFLP